MKVPHRHLFFMLLLSVILCFCCSCGKQQEEPVPAQQSAAVKYEPGKTTVLNPLADGKDTKQADPLTLDFSHVDQGYFIGRLSEAIKVNIQVTGPDNITYKYFFEKPDEDTVFPFTAGSGAYIVLAFENVTESSYVPLISYSLDVQLENSFLPFLYPNQFVNFSEDCEAIRLAAELTADADSDLKALDNIYEYVIQHITYDDDKAATVETGYLPDVDRTLVEGKGICFDYAALTVSMLRASSIPSRLNIGYSGNIRHAWVDVYIESMGWVKNAIQFSGDQWQMMDPTFAAALDIKQAVDYSSDPDNYILEYIR